MRLLLALAALLLPDMAAAQQAGPPPNLAPPNLPTPTVQVEVTRAGGAFVAEYRFARRARAWLFNRSALLLEERQPWRPRSWTVETPGVRIERHGHHDVLVAASGDVPARVRIRVAPLQAILQADYAPALTFADGSVALFSGHFGVTPVADPAAVDAMPLDLNGVDLGEAMVAVTFRDPGRRVLHIGRRFDSATLYGDTGAYVLFGDAALVENEAIAALFDAGLPEWLRRELSATTPAILAYYADALGPAGPGRPMLFVTWTGPTPRLVSFHGSVLPGLITMNFEGAGAVTENPGLRDRARRFIAHEAAHFWLGQIVRYALRREAWIMEGGADLLAIRASQAADPAFDARAALQASVDECAAFISRGRGVASAEDRGENRAYYACGAVFGMVVEAKSGQPFVRFVRGLVDANREDGILTRAEWLAAFDAAVRDPALRARIEALLDEGATDPGAALAGLLRGAGIAFTAGPDGIPRLS